MQGDGDGDGAPSRWAWLRPPVRARHDRAAAVTTLWYVSWALLAGELCLFPLALSDPRNPPLSVLAFNGPIVAVLVLVLWLTRRGFDRAAGWILCTSTWLMVSSVLLFAGGLSGHNGVAYTLTVTLAGVVLGLRAGIAVAVASSVFAGGVAWLQEQGRLPQGMSEPTPWNSWTALAVTLLISTLVLSVSLRVLSRALNDAEKSLEEKRVAQQRLAQAQKLELVGRVSAGVAHDINNLLTVVQLTAEVLRGNQGTAAGAEVVRDLDTAIATASAMTRRLLALGRPEGAPDPAREVDLHAAVLDALPLLQRLVGEQHQLRTEGLVKGGGRVLVAPTAIDQVVLNLVLNARDAMPEGGTITLRAGGTSGVGIEVVDEGIGMDAETKARIFEPFFTTKPTGTGLGLATVRQLVTAAGGSLDVTSEPGRGACFRFELPASSSEAGTQSNTA